MKTIDFIRLHSVAFVLQGVVDKAMEHDHVTETHLQGVASKVYSGARMRKRKGELDLFRDNYFIAIVIVAVAPYPHNRY